MLCSGFVSNLKVSELFELEDVDLKIHKLINELMNGSRERTKG